MTRSTSTAPADQHRRARRRLLKAGAASLGAALLSPLAARAQDAESRAAAAQDPAARSDGVSQSAGSPVTTKDLGGLALLQVADCNVLAMHGDDGALMVDGGPVASADELLRAVYAATGNDRVKMLINTHWHLEQIGANELVGRTGGVIFATEKTKTFLSHAVYADSYERAREPLPEAARPTQTTRGDGSFEFAGKRVDYGYLPAAHTDGDLFVHFPRLNVLAAGGVVSGETWPLLDWRNGAWLGGRVRALERLAGIVKPDTGVVPAQGRLITGRDVVHLRDVYDELFVTMIGYMNDGLGWPDVVERGPLKKYEAELGDASAFLESAYRSMQIAYVPD